MSNIRPMMLFSNKEERYSFFSQQKGTLKNMYINLLVTFYLSSNPNLINIGSSNNNNNKNNNNNNVGGFGYNFSSWKAMKNRASDVTSQKGKEDEKVEGFNYNFDSW
jgi:hypothetical protein